jgi:hypothetical protein
MCIDAGALVVARSEHFGLILFKQAVLIFQ